MKDIENYRVAIYKTILLTLLCVSCFVMFMKLCHSLSLRMYVCRFSITLVKQQTVISLLESPKVYLFISQFWQ